jgi:hypothetical protein
MKRQFLIVTEEDKDISGTLSQAFNKGRGSVSLSDLDEAMKRRFRFNPARVTELDERSLSCSNQDGEKMIRCYPVYEGRICVNSFYWM